MAPTPHLILTLGRSGSNYLVNAINQAPEAINYGEVLGTWTLPRRVLGRAYKDPAAYMDALYDGPLAYQALMAGRNVRRLGRKPLDWPRRSSLDVLGAKDFAVTFRDAGIATYPAERADLKVIGVTRTNTVRRVVSGRFMQATKVIGAVGTDVDLDKVTVDPDEFVRLVRLYEGERSALREQLDAVPAERRIEYTYEDVFASPEATTATLSRVFDFLGLPYRGETSNHRKLIAKPLPQMIANYGALRERLQDEGLADQLEDDRPG